MNDEMTVMKFWLKGGREVVKDKIRICFSLEKLNFRKLLKGK